MPRDTVRHEETNYLAPVLIAISVAAGLFIWYLLEQPTGQDKPEPPAAVAKAGPASGKIETPEIKYPVPAAEPGPSAMETREQPESTPPPVVETEIPQTIEEEFYGLYDRVQFGDLFLMAAPVQQFVVTVDNMTAPKLPQKFAFTRPPAGKFAVLPDTPETQLLDARNFERYNLYIHFAETSDMRALVSFYIRHYSLFQAAYEELGYPGRYFNDRFVEVVDHLLAAPDVPGPVKLVRPKVYYQFADPELEALSAGQKLLIRIGPDNARKIKSKLVELREVLTALKKQ